MAISKGKIVAIGGKESLKNYTATQKIKRHQVIMLYKEDINTLLKSHGESILFD